MFNLSDSTPWWARLAFLIPSVILVGVAILRRAVWTPSSLTVRNCGRNGSASGLVDAGAIGKRKWAMGRGGCQGRCLDCARDCSMKLPGYVQHKAVADKGEDKPRQVGRPVVQGYGTSCTRLLISGATCSRKR